MKRLLISMLVILVLTVMTPGTVFAKAPLHQVMGGGSLQFPEGVTYSFTAIQLDIDGNAKGVLRFTDHVSSRTFQADVKYLSVKYLYATNTPSAWISAVITKGDERMEEGTYVGIRVHDNGEGKGANDPDGISIVQYDVDPAWALEQDGIPMGILIHGNVQIR